MSSDSQQFVHYVCLYTHQKHKKRKIWQDGYAHVDSTRKLVLFDDARKCPLDSLQLPDAYGEVSKLNGLETESEKFLIMLEDIDLVQSCWPGIESKFQKPADSNAAANSQSSTNSSFEAQRTGPRRRKGLRAAQAFRPPQPLHPGLGGQVRPDVVSHREVSKEKSHPPHSATPASNTAPSGAVPLLQLWHTPNLPLLSLFEASNHSSPMEPHEAQSAAAAIHASPQATLRPGQATSQTSMPVTSTSYEKPMHHVSAAPASPSHTAAGSWGAASIMSSVLLWPAWLHDAPSPRSQKRPRGASAASAWAPLGYPLRLQTGGGVPVQVPHATILASAARTMTGGASSAQGGWAPWPFPLHRTNSATEQLSGDPRAAFLLWLAGQCLRQCNLQLLSAGTKYTAAGGVSASQAVARRAGVALYSNVKLLKIPAKKGSADGEASAANGPRFFLVLDGSSDKEHSSKYSLGNLWVISTSRRFNAGADDCVTALKRGTPVSKAGGRGGSKASKGGWFGGGAQRSSQRFLFFARAAYHGISSKNMLQVLPVSDDACFAPPSLGSGAVEAAVCAVRVGIDGSELHTLAHTSRALRDLIGNAAAPSARLVPALAEPPLHPFPDASEFIQRASSDTGGAMTDLGTPERLMQNTFANFNLQFKLNKQQRQVLATCLLFVNAGTVSMPGAAPPGVGLVRGIFGAGKSHTLVASICACLALSQALQATGSSKTSPEHVRILVLAGTNVAVDRILLGLLDVGCESFSRVGSVRAIAPPILPYVLQGGGSAEGLASSRQEMHSILTAHAATSATSSEPSSAAALQRALKRLGRAETQGELRGAPVVGCTLASAHSEAMQGMSFDLVILDEASQVTVPAAMGPLLRSGARGALLVGDPAQLPPPMSGIDKMSSGVENDPLDSAGLFDAMQTAGAREIPLSMQYRCHPEIAGVASRLFYAGAVTSGVTAEQRPGLFQHDSPLVFLDTSDSSAARAVRSGGGGSLSNPAETAAVLRATEELLATGAALPKQIGIICTYRAQVAAVQAALAQLAVAARNTGEKLEAAARGGPGGYDGATEGLARVAQADTVQVATVDAFQGNERDVVIVSTVHCGPAADAARFIDDPRRVNVALTRAKRAFVLVGHGPTLRACKHWGGIVAASQGRVVGGLLSRLPPLPVASAARVRLAMSARAPMCVLALKAPPITPTEPAGGAASGDAASAAAGQLGSAAMSGGTEEDLDEENGVWDALTQ